MSETYDVGDDVPADVTGLIDYTDGDCDDCTPRWGRTGPDEWKGHKDGGKAYLSTAELLRRWGPLTRRTT